MRTKTEGVDFQRDHQDRGSRIVILAPHAGGIEPGTGKLAKTIAGQNYSYYLFEGLQRKGNQTLHIPSTQFNDPLCLNLLQKTETALALHGTLGTQKNVYVGGLNQSLMACILDHLIERGYQAERDLTDHAGRNPANICNRCSSKQGVQLEISQPLRKTFFKTFDRKGREQPTEESYRFTSTIRKAILDYE
jgi:phage replication-related protein YjqB (UPF0714/DUF867 family)